MRHPLARTIAVLIAVCLATSADPAAAEQASGVQSATQPKGGYSYTPRPPPGAVPDESPSPEVYDPDCGKPEDHDEADLCVQREAVKASKNAVWWAAFQSYVAIAGLVGVITSLMLAGWAAHESRKSAVASRESADVARRTFAELQRPWMFLSLDEVSQGKDEAGGFYRVSFTFRNHGGSPAIIERYGATMLLVTEQPDPATIIGAEIRWDRVLASGGTTEPFPCDVHRLQSPTVTAIREGRLDVCFFGFIDYKGVNGVDGRTEFSLVYDGRTRWFMPRGEKHNRYT